MPKAKRNNTILVENISIKKLRKVIETSIDYLEEMEIFTTITILETENGKNFVLQLPQNLAFVDFLCCCEYLFPKLNVGSTKTTGWCLYSEKDIKGLPRRQQLMITPHLQNINAKKDDEPTIQIYAEDGTIWLEQYLDDDDPV